MEGFNIDFPFILVVAVIFAGVVSLIDVLFFAKKRRKNDSRMPIIIEYSRSFFPVLLLVLIIRSFIFQPYRVPTGSLEPTVLPGDFIAVSQYAYGLRLPVLGTKILPINEPKKGDIALFYWPVNPKIIFVKRVVGTPGDKLEYKNKILYVNGEEMKQTSLGMAENIEPGRLPIPVEKRRENLMGVEHDIFVLKDGGWTGEGKYEVPEGHYFMMGDNRDFSDDSRSWGLVPENALIGKAFAILLSWDSNNTTVRTDRFFKSLN